VSSDFNNDFKFNTAEVVPQTPVEVTSGLSTTAPAPVAPQGSDASRIEAARAQLLRRERDSNSDPTFGGRHQPRFFQDFGFGSACLARHIVHQAQMIQTPLGGKLIPLGISHEYNPRSGRFEFETYGATDFSLADLTAAYRARISELGLSEVLLEEHSAKPSTWVDDNAFYALPFEQRMDIFRAKA
jgi:hypothetical protein